MGLRCILDGVYLFSIHVLEERRFRPTSFNPPAVPLGIYGWISVSVAIGSLRRILYRE